ncbi:MAG: hypothetical protein KatS3mg099_013 [Candidatus Parcubacteria bacterium]|nr:MAG: hypothetical protein KatS3mg099_013 [Candidatus Parcubacteria bacterium]
MVPYWLNSLIGFVALGLEVALVITLALWVGRSRLPSAAHLFHWVGKGWWAVAVAVGSLGAIVMSLYYEFSGFPPCFWCWMARVFFYPLPLMLAVGWARREVETLAPYVLSFALAGMGVTFYQHLLQMGAASGGVCSAVGGIDCAERWFFELGHITFPWVGFVMFAWFAFFAWAALQYHKRGHAS